MLSFLKQIKAKLFHKSIELRYHTVDKVESFDIKQKHNEMNICFLVFDSCRYDTLLKAKTPVLDSYGKTYQAYSPATFTLPAHMAIFAGMLPLTYEKIPYLNRFEKQLISMKKSSVPKPGALGKYSIELEASSEDIIYGLKQQGYYTVGAAGTTWFAKSALTRHFNDFQYVRAQSCEEQMNFVLSKLASHSEAKPFFAFMNLIETHSPYMHYGDDKSDYVMDARNSMQFPPAENTDEIIGKGKKLHTAQIAAAEHLDKRMQDFLIQLPENTLVVLMADHGECFGEDGFWGHGIYHPKVMEVPMMCFSLDGSEPLCEKSHS